MSSKVERRSKKLISVVLMVSFLITNLCFPVWAKQASSSDTPNKGIEDCGIYKNTAKSKTVIGKPSQPDLSDGFIDPIRDKEYILQRQKENLERNNVEPAEYLNIKEKTEILVKFKDDAAGEKIKTKLKSKLKLSKLNKKKKIKNIELLEIGGSDDSEALIKELQNDNNVEFAQYNYRLYARSLPEDSMFNEQWELYNTSQAVDGQTGISGVDINVLPAWNISTGSDDVVVGILDTGTDVQNNDLKANIYVNSKEIAGNGVDDDGNGYIDDIEGFDFANDDDSVYDSSSMDVHGTFVAGQIAAAANTTGTRGVANVKILPLKFMNGDSGYTSDAIEGINYAKKMGVKIINCSWGSTYYNGALKEAMKDSGILYVCAAGNDGMDVSSLQTYPACFDLDNVLSVAAIDNRGNLTQFSNYGSEIDVAAPGKDILGITPENGYIRLSGTSCAAPLVTGIAVLIKSYLASETPLEIKSRIINNVVTSGSLTGKVASGGRVDAYAALTNIKPQPDSNSMETNNDPIGNDSYYDNINTAMATDLMEMLHYGENGINPGTGNYSRTYTDMSLDAPGFKINISRTYNSKSNRVGPFGRGWSFGFEGNVCVNGNDVTVTLPNGSVQTFLAYSDGKNFRAEDSRSQLIKQTDGTYLLTTKDQYTYKFKSVNYISYDGGYGYYGFLSEMKDRNSNTIVITVDTNGKITKITDAAGRYFSVLYNANGCVNYIKQYKTDNTTIVRTVEYLYNSSNNQLERVIDPSGSSIYYYYTQYADLQSGTTKWYLSQVKDNTNSTVTESIVYYTSGTDQNKAKTITDAYSNTVTYVYDNINRITTMTDSNSRQIIKYYDSYYNTIKSQDPEGTTVSVEYPTEKWAYKGGLNYQRGGLTTAVLNGKIYAIGGNFTKYVEEYDPITDKWSRKADMPTQRYGMTVAAVNGKIYAIGGYALDSTMLTTVEAYDPATDTWTFIGGNKKDADGVWRTYPGGVTYARYSMASAVVNGKIYIIGGQSTNDWYTAVEEYNPADASCRIMTPMTAVRPGLGAAVVNGKIYAVGGTCSNKIEEFDPASGTLGAWKSTLSGMTTARASLGVAAVNGKVYAIGGDGGGCLDKVEEYDPINDTWSTKLPMQTARMFFGAVSLNGKIYTVGGTNSIGTLWSMEEYEPDTAQFGEEKAITTGKADSINPDQKTVVAGGEHVLKLLSDGTVEAWGSNRFGELGLGDTADRTSPTLIPGLSNVKEVFPGYGYSFALMKDGTVKAWGSNCFGMLGLGDKTDRLLPVTVPGLTGVKQIACYGFHVIALMNDGTVKAWGDNLFYVLGLGDENDRYRPVTIQGLTGVKMVSTGEFSSFAVLNDGSVYGWGLDTYVGFGLGYVGIKKPTIMSSLYGIKSIKVCYNSIFALKNDGSVLAWGDNTYGVLGLGDNTDRNTPTLISGLTGVKEICGNGGGCYQSFALMNDGSVRACGSNYDGGLGFGYTGGTFYTFTPIGLNGVKQIDNGFMEDPANNNRIFSFVIMNDNTIKVWGDNNRGQLGLDNTNSCLSPTLAPYNAVDPSPGAATGMINILPAAIGPYNTSFLTDESEVNICGINNYGQLGFGDEETRSVRQVIPNIKGIKQVAFGQFSTYLLMNDGTVKAFGMNNFGNLALGDINRRNTPTAIPGLSGVKKIAAGQYHVLALMNDGHVKAWGYNMYGQLGQGDTSPKLTPVDTGLSGVKDIEAGMNSSYAILSDGKVMVCGQGLFGGLGLGDTANRYSFVENTNLDGAKQISAGMSHGIALMADGKIKTWGYNGFGQLGFGDTTDRYTPAEITSLAGQVKQITAGTFFCMVLMNDVTVKSWGCNNSGQLGLGDTRDRYVPTAVTGLNGIKQLVAKYSNAAAIKSDGTIMMWGYNNGSNFGLGDVEARFSPVYVNGSRTEYLRDDRGNIIKVTNPDGGYSKYSYDDKNNLVMERDEYGNSTYYVYDAGGINLLKKVQPQNGTDNYIDGVSEKSDFSITEYQYFDKGNIKGLLQKVIDPENVTGIRDIVTVYDYDSYGNLTSVTEPSDTNPLGKVTNYDYYDTGWKKYTVSPGKFKTEYFYDNTGRLEKTKQNNGDGSTAYPITITGTTRITYDAMGRKTKEVSPNLYNSSLDTTPHVYSGDHGSRYSYNANGTLYSLKDAENNTTIHDLYDCYGNLKKETKPNGAIYLYDYDSMNRLIRTSFQPDQNTSPVILEEYYYNMLPDGKMQKSQVKYLNDTDTAVTIYTYDYKNRLIKQQNPDGTDTKTVYNLNGTINSTTDANGYTTYYTYDGLNRLSGKWSPVEIQDGFVIFTCTGYFYDKSGKLTDEKKGKEFVYLYADPQNYEIKTYNYSKDGEVSSVYENDVKKTEYLYDDDGNITQEDNYTDTTNKNTTAYLNNYLGKPYSKTVKVKTGDLYSNPFDYSTDAPALTTDYTYDLNGNLKTEVTPDGTNTRYEYDNMDRQTVMSQQSKGEDGTTAVNIITAARYNWEGKPVETKDGEGYAARYEYDKRGFPVNVCKGSIISDTESTGGRFVKTGTWSSVNGAYKGYSTGSTLYSTAAGSTAKWIPEFSSGGYYKVYVWYPGDSTNTTSAKYTVTYKTGSADVYINQTANAGSWVPLGTGSYEFTAGSTGSVTLSVASSQKHRADAVMFVPDDASGQKTTYEYDRAGRKISEISPNFSVTNPENKTVYTYDIMSRVKIVEEKYTDPDTLQNVDTVTRAYKYNNNGSTIKELDALGYDAGIGTTADEKINSGYGTEYTYNMSDIVVSVLDPVSKGRGLSFTNSYDYDALGRKITEINGKGIVTDYYYDDSGNMTDKKVVNPSTGQEQTVQANTYDLLGNLLTQTDGNGNVTRYEYNPLNKIRKVIYPGDATDVTISEDTVYYQYDNAGNLKLKQDTMGTLASTDDDILDVYEYDNQGKVLKQTHKNYAGTESASTETRYDRNGNKVRERDGKGTWKTNSYDEYNRLTSANITVTIIDNSTVNHTTAYSYDKNGNQLTATDWRGNTYENVYDTINRLIQKKDPYSTYEKLEYNKNNKQSKSYSTFDGTAYYATEYTYDKNNRLISTEDPEGHITSQTYDNAGNIGTKTDGRGNPASDGENHITRYSYDEFNRLVNVQNAKSENTSYTYDLAGNLLTQTDGRSKVTTFEYNARNKLKRKIDHGGRSGTAPNYTYDNTKAERYTGYYADGSLETKIDRNGKTTIYEYNANGKVKKVTADSSTIIQYTYDGNGNTLTVSGGAEGTITRSYDELNRVKTKNVSDMGTIEYTYDIIIDTPEAKCTAEQMKDFKNNITLKTYDRAGRLKEVTDVSGANRKTAYTYNANGSRRNTVYSDNSRTDYTYYRDNLLWTLTNRNANGTIIDSYTYYYDAAHNQTKKTDAKGDTNYTYDVLNRLETVTEPGGKNTSYTYDMSGNRATGTIVGGSDTTVSTYGYNDQNRLTGITTRLNNVTSETCAYTYDNNGNQQTITRTPYSGGVPQTAQTTGNIYDVFNQLTSTTLPDSTSIQYGYNAEGLRVNKTVSGVLTRYLYEYDKVILELDPAGAQKARNIYGTNLISRTVGSLTLNYMYNGHGDVTALCDATAVANIAGGKTITGSVTVTNAAYATNGSTNTSQYSSIGSNLQWAKLDFGQSEYIDRVKLWHYFSDSRKYKDVIVQFSNDANFASGVTTVFNNDTNNSAGQGTGTNAEYSETSSGNEIKFRPVYARYIRLWSNGSSVNTGNHIVELEVYRSNVVATYYYDAFGNITDQTGIADNNITYAGYQYDKETGLYYCNSRMYDPKVARFMQEDTYTGDPNDPLSLNLYTYCHNEPVMYDDPTGHTEVYLDGRHLSGLTADYISTLTNGKQQGDYKIYVKLASFMGAIGGTSSWDSSSKTARSYYNGQILNYNFSTKEVTNANGNKQGFNFYVIDNTTYVPIRDVATYFGMGFDYEASYQVNPYTTVEAVFIKKPTNNVSTHTPPAPTAPITPTAQAVQTTPTVKTTPVPATPAPSVVKPAPVPPAVTPNSGSTFIADLGNGLKAVIMNAHDLFQGIGAGVLESITFGESNKIEVYYDRNSDKVYLVGKIIGDTISGAISGECTFDFGVLTIGTSPTVVGAIVCGTATVYCGSVTLSSAINATANIQSLVHAQSSNNNSSGGGNNNSNQGGNNAGGTTKNTKTPWDIKTNATDKIDYKINGQNVSAYKDPNTGLYWARDTEGHGGSAFKVFELKKGGKELQWKADADEFGNFITDKHKGSTGLTIKVK